MVFSSSSSSNNNKKKENQRILGGLRAIQIFKITKSKFYNKIVNKVYSIMKNNN